MDRDNKIAIIMMSLSGFLLLASITRFATSESRVYHNEDFASTNSVSVKQARVVARAHDRDREPLTDEEVAKEIAEDLKEVSITLDSNDYEFGNMAASTNEEEIIEYIDDDLTLLHDSVANFELSREVQDFIYNLRIEENLD